MMSRSTILVIAMACTVMVGHGQDMALYSAGLTLAGQPGWSSTLNTFYYGEGAAFLRIGANTNSVSGSIPITGAPGTYRFWLRARSINDDSTGGAVLATMGDAVRSFTWPTSDTDWHDAGVYSPSISFTNVSLVFTNNTVTNLHDYYVAAATLISNTNKAFVDSLTMAFSKNLLADYAIPGHTNLSDIAPGNLVANSGFELGSWIWSRDTGATNKSIWLRQALDSNNPKSGSYCLRIGNPYARYQIFSAPVYLRGSNTVRAYTVSIEARGDGSGTQLTCDINPTVPAVAGLPYSNKVSVVMGSPTTNWTRYSKTVYLSQNPSPQFFLTFQHISSTASIWVDNLIMNEGTNALPWEPCGGIESAVLTARDGGLYLQGDPVVLDLVTSNGATNRPVIISSEIYDWKNRLVTNIVTAFVAPAGTSTNKIYPPTTPGPYRILTSILGVSARPTETAYAVGGFPAGSGQLMDSPWGTHAASYPAALASNRVWGLHRARVFSTASIKWPTLQPTSNTTDYATSDFIMGQMVGGAKLLVALGDMKGTPAWAFTSGGKEVNHVALSNYVYNLVSRYGTNVSDLETDNEPFAGTVEYFTTNQVAAMISTEVLAAKAANPNIRIWAGGGYIVTGKLASVVGLLPTNVWSQIHGLTCHLYPKPDDNNLLGYDDRVQQFAKLGRDLGRPVMNSEWGVWDIDAQHVSAGWVTRCNYVYLHEAEEMDVRPHGASQSILACQGIRCVANGMIVQQYDSRLSGKHWGTPDSQPYMLRFDDVITAKGLAYITAANLIADATPFGLVTNTNANGGTNLEVYAFGPKAVGSLAAVWPRILSTNFVINLGSVSNFAVLDVYGAQLSTNTPSFTLNRTPTYVVSSTLTTNAMIAALQAATVTPVADTTAPALTLDAAPRGRVTAQSLPLVWKYTAADDRHYNTPANNNRVVARRRITGYGDWSSWSMERRDAMESLPPDGVYSYDVETKDIIGASTNRVSAKFIVGQPGRATVPTLSVGRLNN